MPIANVQGIDVYYEVHGKGEPVVLVSGFTANHGAWSTLVPVYASHYQVIVFDNRGIGQSACPAVPYTAEMMADDAVGLMQSLGLASAHLVGHSFGGCVVQAIARRHPHAVRSAVISCSFLKANMRLAQYGRLRLEMLRRATPDSIAARFVTLMCMSNAFMAAPGAVEELIEAGTHPIGEAGLESQLHALVTFDSRGWIGELQCPALLIGADEDLLADLGDTRFMAGSIAGSELYCFQGTGHMPMTERSDTFNELVLDFLDRVERRRRIATTERSGPQDALKM